MKNVLISGGAGFIGSNLAIRLVEKGYNVRVLDSLSPQIHGPEPEVTSPLYASIRNKVEFFKGSVTCKEDWLKVLPDQDILVHLAAETGTGQSMYQVHRYVDVNIGGTALMLDTLTNNNHKITKMVLASSRAVYGEGSYLCSEHKVVYPEMRIEKDLLKGDFECKCPVCSSNVTLIPTKEESRINPTSIYGITKQNQEQIIMVVGKSLDIPAVVFRYQNVYGPGQSLSNPYTGILSIFSTQMKNGNDINIFEDGKESRDFVYIDDVVSATISGIEQESANYQIFNVGSNEPVSVITVAKLLKENYNANVNVNISRNFRIGDIRHNYADLSRIGRMLDYKPQTSFQQGIRKFCSWVETQPVQQDKYQQSILEMKNKGFYR